MKKLLAAILLLALALQALAAGPPSAPAPATGLNFFTVATLPSAAAVPVNLAVIVTDGNAVGDCSGGGGSTRSICISNGSGWNPAGDGTGGAASISDSVYAAAWNGVDTIAPTKNAIYDYLHLFDTDDDGKVNVLDTGAGLVKTDANGVVATAGAGTDYLAPAAIGVTVQAYDAELAALSGLTSAANKVPYFTGSGSADVADFTAAGRSVVGAVDAAAIRTYLSLVPGTNVQAYDAELAALAGLTSAANKVPYFTGSGSADVADFTAAGRSVVGAADAAAIRTYLGLVIGTNVQAQNANLSDLADGAMTATLVDIANATAIGSRASADSLLVYNVSAGANRRITVGNFIAGLGGAGGSIILDLGDDGSNESTALTEIATVGTDAAGVFSNSGDKFIIDISKAWPVAAVANAGDSATAFFSSGTVESNYGGTGINTSASTGVPSIAAGTWSVAAQLANTRGGTGKDTSGDTGVPTISTGTWSVAAQLSALRGGTGINTSASTGVPSISSGTWSVAATLTNALGGTGQNSSAWTGIPNISSGTWAQLAPGAQYHVIASANGTAWSSQALTASYLPAATVYTSSTGITMSGAAVTFGDADTDVLTLRSLIQGGNSRAVWIADTAPSPTYATGTTDLYVKGKGEFGGVIYAAGFQSTAVGGDSLINLVSNASTPASAGTNSLYVVGNAWKFKENGSEKDVLFADDSITWTGATHNFAGVSNLLLPTADADSAGEISINRTSRQLIWHDGTAAIKMNTTGIADGKIMKWVAANGQFEVSDDATAGSPLWSSLGAPTGNLALTLTGTYSSAFTYSGTGTHTYNFTGNFSTGSQFLIEQKTGDPSGGTLFEVKAADSSAVVAKIGDGTNGLQVAAGGAVSLIGNGTFTAGGVILGDSSPDASGEFGYASNAFVWFANSEDLSLTAGTNLWTFASTTSATFAFTPAVAFNAGIQVKNGATGPGFIDFFEDSDNGTNYVRLIGLSSTGDITITLPASTDTLVGRDTTDSFTNKTFDAAATGNVLKQYSYIMLTASGFKVRGSSTTAPSTTQTDFNYGLPKFSNSADKATNFIDWVIQVPGDIDTAVDLTATLQFFLGGVGTDTGDHEYIVSMVSIATSAAADGTPGTAISLGYTADGTGATGDYETTSETTLTGWRSALTGGQLWRVRLERDGDHANDTSTADSYPLVLVLKYGSTQ
jgi:hypothetical protein